MAYSNWSMAGSHYPLIYVPEPVAGLSKKLPPPVPRYRCQSLPEKPRAKKTHLGVLIAEGTAGLTLWLSALAVMQGAAISLGGVFLGLMLLVIRIQIAQNRAHKAQVKRYQEAVRSHLMVESYRREAYREMVREREEILNDPSRLSAYRRQILNDALSSIQCFRNPAADWQEPEKAYEFRFLNYLERYFPGRVYRGNLLLVPDLPPDCVLDFAYIDTVTGIHINIEVDEPFFLDASTGSCEPRNFVGSSDLRDKLLADKGWIVIHFAEEQVIRAPKSCCKAVALTIADLTGNQFLLAAFEDIPKLQPVPRWTAEESMRMAVEEFRSRKAQKKAAGVKSRLLPDQSRAGMS
ncbi:hypothetical protein [Leptolyngbya sp. FACHB-261]|uniref:hypothetical protein n=1 Tax=Leptolyngbya sp. FACHB-261 TaxID=2692806 RepID=UPI001686291C|nr:hypothetical protein [Leptolyngbya sp. FACHB-261]MBD2100842.1 hypothetical protein [Leptolyngbya sp. FACHB-261]